MANEGRKPRGALIVVEGLDRAGKTSQCHQLIESLAQREYSVKYKKFPARDSLTGKIINSYLQGASQQDDHSIHLLFSANRWEAAQEIKSDLFNGTTVIVDRYSYSGAVYSAAKENPELSLEWAWQPEVGLPRPDILLFLSLSPEAAAERAGYGGERYETDSMQTRVRHLFERLLSMAHGHEVHVIDAGSSIDEVTRSVLSTALKFLSERNPTVALDQLRPWHKLKREAHAIS